MPGYLSINDSMKIWKEVADQKLQVKQSYGKVKLQEYYSQELLLRPAEKTKLENEIFVLQKEIQQLLDIEQKKIEAKRSLWVFSYWKKIDSVALIIAEEKKYQLILNQVYTDGRAFMLYGPESLNLMNTFADKLRISLPENYMEVFRRYQKE